MWIVSRWCGTPVNTPPCGTPANTPLFWGGVRIKTEKKEQCGLFTLVRHSSTYSSVWCSSQYSPFLVRCSNQNKPGTVWIVSRWCGTPVSTLHLLVRRSNQTTAQAVGYAMVPRWFSTPVNTLLSGPARQTKNNNTMNTVSNYLHVGLVLLRIHSLLVQESKPRTAR